MELKGFFSFAMRDVRVQHLPLLFRESAQTSFLPQAQELPGVQWSYPVK
jgi:hypothetical protein